MPRKSHPLQCHLCQFNGVNAPGKPLDAEAANACLHCEGIDMKNVHDGVSWVSIDAAEKEDGVTFGRIAPDYFQGKEAPAPTLPGKSESTAEWLKHLYCEIAAMSSLQTRIIHGIGNGMTVFKVACLENLPMSNIEFELRTALRSNPRVRTVWFLARAGKLPNFTSSKGKAKWVS